MHITVLGKNIKLTDGIKRHVDKEFGKIVKLAPANSTLRINLSAIPGGRTQRVEATLVDRGVIARAECESANLYDSINEASDVLARRLKKHNEMQRRFNADTIRTMTEEASEREKMFAEDVPDEYAPVPVQAPTISRIKKIDIAKESREDAAQRMELLGHKFHIFIDAETNAPAVVYKRNNETYGLLVTAGEEV